MISPPPSTSTSQNFNSLPYFHYICIQKYVRSQYPHRYTPGAEGWMLVFAIEWVSVWFPQPNNTYATNRYVVYEPKRKIKFPLQQYCENNGFFLCMAKKTYSMYANAVIPFTCRRCRLSDEWYIPNEIEKLRSSKSGREENNSLVWLLFCVDVDATAAAAVVLFSSYLILLNLSLYVLMKNLVQLKLRHRKKRHKFQPTQKKTRGKIMCSSILLTMIIVIQLVLFPTHKAGHRTFHFQFHYNDLQTFIHFGMCLLSFPHSFHLPFGRSVSV